MAWTNSQLKKLPGSKVVEDLARDMQDGVALAQLIEVVGMFGSGVASPTTLLMFGIFICL